MRTIAGTTWSVEDAKAYIEERAHKVPWSGCWLWGLSLNRAGYGKLHTPRQNKPKQAHRVSYEAFVGAIPSGMFVCHRCDVPACCNPDHLWMGTHQENMDDMIAKGRASWPGAHGEKNGNFTKPTSRPRGERHGMAKLQPEQVLEIRADTSTLAACAGRHGVSLQMVWRIRRRLAWRHLP